jgi:uncharacterized protein (DUF2126 family)
LCKARWRRHPSVSPTLPGFFIGACSSRSDKKKNLATVKFEVEVDDNAQIVAVIESMRRIPGVTKAERTPRSVNGLG